MEANVGALRRWLTQKADEMSFGRAENLAETSNVSPMGDVVLFLAWCAFFPALAVFQSVNENPPWMIYRRLMVLCTAIISCLIGRLIMRLYPSKQLLDRQTLERVWNGAWIIVSIIPSLNVILVLPCLFTSLHAGFAIGAEANIVAVEGLVRWITASPAGLSSLRSWFAKIIFLVRALVLPGVGCEVVLFLVCRYGDDLETVSRAFVVMILAWMTYFGSLILLVGPVPLMVLVDIFWVVLWFDHWLEEWLEENCVYLAMVPITTTLAGISGLLLGYRTEVSPSDDESTMAVSTVANDGDGP